MRVLLVRMEMYRILDRWCASAAMPRPVSRAGGLFLLALAPVAVDDDVSRASLDDLAIFRGEVLRQVPPRVMSAHRCDPLRVMASHRS